MRAGVFELLLPLSPSRSLLILHGATKDGQLDDLIKVDLVTCDQRMGSVAFVFAFYTIN